MSGVIYDIFVPNLIPEEPFNILWVGESPGEEEEYQKEPFVGNAGNLLTEVLLKFGVPRYKCGFANLSNYRPQGNKFEILLQGEATQLKQGLENVKKIIEERKPNVVACLGRWPTELLTGKSGISRYRGSILSGFNGGKFIPAYHPSFVTRNKSVYPIFSADIRRIVSDSEFPDFRYTPREYHIVEDEYAAYEWSAKLQQCPSLSVDIESVKKTGEILCVGFSPNRNLAVCFIYNLFTKPLIAKILENESSEKSFHFGTFDVQKLYHEGIIVSNYNNDTFALQRVLEPELPKSLDFLTSVLTREPYYKAEGRGEIPEDTKVWSEKVDKAKLWIYNSKDCCCTKECEEELVQDLKKEPNLIPVYQHDMEMTRIAIAMSRNGMLVDIERKELFKKALLYEWSIKQGFLNTIAQRNINVNGKQKLYDFLYGKGEHDLGLPVRRSQKTGGISANDEDIVAMLTNATSYLANLKRQSAITDWSIKIEALKLIREIRALRKLLSSYIKPKISADGRARSTYKLSTETGRWAAEKFIDQTGFNAQTMPRGDIKIPDNIENAGVDFAAYFNQLEEDEEEEKEAA